MWVLGPTHYLEGMFVDTRAYPFHEGMYVGTRAYPFHEGMLVDTLPITWRECLWILGPTHFMKECLWILYPFPEGRSIQQDIPLHKMQLPEQETGLLLVVQ